MKKKGWDRHEVCSYIKCININQTLVDLKSDK